MTQHGSVNPENIASSASTTEKCPVVTPSSAASTTEHSAVTPPSSASTTERSAVTPPSAATTTERSGFELSSSVSDRLDSSPSPVHADPSGCSIDLYCPEYMYYGREEDAMDECSLASSNSSSSKISDSGKSRSNGKQIKHVLLLPNW